MSAAPAAASPIARAVGAALAAAAPAPAPTSRVSAPTPCRSPAGGRCPRRCRRPRRHGGAGARREIEAELGVLEASWPGDLPAGVIHADLFPDNVFFLGGRLSGLIDFYFACTDLLAYDVAVCLNAWCFEADGSFNVTKGRALLQRYEAVRPLSEAERAALPLLGRGAAMRFLLTRLYDWLNAPPGALVRPKDPLEYLRSCASTAAPRRCATTACGMSAEASGAAAGKAPKHVTV